MSFLGAILPGANAYPAAPGSAVRPGWLRPAALAVILALHAALFFTVKGEPQPLASLDALDVLLVPLGDSPVDQQQAEESKPDQPAPPSPVEQSELTAPPPQVVAPEAIPLPVERPKPVVRPKPAAVRENRPTPADLREEMRKVQVAAERRRQEQEARQEARRGSTGGAATGGMSRASYAALLAGELRRRTFYPAAARAAGVTGSVGVAFTVGPSGRVISQSITRSSGNAALDSAAYKIMSAIHTPPPPGGRFGASTNLRFNFH